ncbi:MAG: aminotransferase class I/II-fold pyridoxal phosphate-dependent enzyme, partial [Actinomycetota bacterium]|nr:aminotransferase class I/II-fold pyridoxal phosphate-dependent enzyme [Actinomycetota bacterium]
MSLADRMGRLGTETAFSVLVKAKALEARGREVIHLEIGEPDFDTAEHIVEAGCRALREGQTHYTPAAGIPELREAIAADVARSRSIEIGPEQVVVTPGGKPIMFFTILALV